MRELAKLRQGISRKFRPETWLKQDLSTAFQAVEDVVVQEGLVLEDAVQERTTTNGRSQVVDNARKAGVFTGGLAGLLPIVEDWLTGHPVTTIERKVEEVQLIAWAATHNSAFADAVVGLPLAIQNDVVFDLMRMRVKKVL